jgi:FKBP-type peptidyl-prolyl cis-trans isomerase
MNKLLKGFSIGLVVLLAVSCSKTPSVFKGFQKMETGAYMKFYEKSGSGVSPRLNDGVTFEMAQYFNDSLLFDTKDSEPIDIILEPASFEGDVTDALLMMQVGDSARLVVLADSVFVAIMDMVAPEEYAGKPIYYDLKLLSVRPFEEIEAENQRVADSLKALEEAFLAPLRNDAKNSVTESGLIVMEQKGKGKVAQMGDYVDFDFLMCDRDGDTMMCSYGIESVVMQYGEQFVCEGFQEALGMVPQGGVMRFVIPSELGFGSEGYRGVAAPYEPIVAKLTMNEVMNKEAYDKKMAAQEAKAEVEKQQRLAMEKGLIEAYLQKNGIDEKPTESGLYILREQEGTGSVAQWGDVVAVHYTLYNLDGDEIESSYGYGEPMRFTIGNGEMIPCIEEAVMTMAPGAKVTLVSPSNLGFGEFAIHEELLPAYSPLVIDLELVSIE